MGAYLKLAELNYFLKDYKKVIELANKALESDKDNAVAYFIKGRSVKEAGDTTTAVKCFMKAISLDQKYYDAYIQLGIVFAAKKNPLALQYYNNALNIDANNPQAIYSIGMYNQEIGDYNKAAESFSSIIQVNPTGKYAQYSAWANYNLGYINTEILKKQDQAVKYFTNAIAKDTNYVEAIYMRGLASERLGDFQNAKKDYKKALAKRAEYPKALAGLNRLDDRTRGYKK